MSQVPVPHSIRSQTTIVNGSRMHYLEAGVGNPIVLLHGNPTSSFLWRNVIPHLADHGRCIAIDCIGMGQSDKPALSYRLVDHIDYIMAFLDVLGLTNITFVTHDWGVVIGLYICRHWPERVCGIAFMEGHIHPIQHWEEMDQGAQSLFKQLRTEQPGQTLAIEQNIFVETILPSGMFHTLTPEEMEAYRAPFREKSARFPLWQWPNEIPIEGHPADVHAIVSANQDYLATAALPKLLLYGQPGAVIGANEVAWCKQTCRNLNALDIGAGIHFLPEDNPDTIGSAIADWCDTLTTPCATIAPNC